MNEDILNTKYITNSLWFINSVVIEISVLVYIIGTLQVFVKEITHTFDYLE